MNPLRHKFLPISFTIACIGLLYSTYNILSIFIADDTCLLENCSIFSNFTFMGFSLWWLSAIFFACILLLSLFGIAFIIRVLTATALFADILLFIVMLNTTVCIKCMGVGLLFALQYYAIRYENRRPIAPYPKTVLLTVWALFFVALLGSGFSAKQNGYAILASENATTNIFFSPSCSACSSLVAKEYANKNISWYPVEENENDVWYIIYMQKELSNGANLLEALNKVKAMKPENIIHIKDSLSLEYFKMQYNIWKNSAIVKRRTTNIPYIEVFGSPKQSDNSSHSISLVEPTKTAKQTENTVEQLIGKDTAICGEAVPCEE